MADTLVVGQRRQRIIFEPHHVASHEADDRLAGAASELRDDYAGFGDRNKFLNPSLRLLHIHPDDLKYNAPAHWLAHQVWNHQSLDTRRLDLLRVPVSNGYILKYPQR